MGSVMFCSVLSCHAPMDSEILLTFWNSKIESQWQSALPASSLHIWGLLMYWMLRVCEADREYVFHKFMNGRGIQKPEQLNGRGPKRGCTKIFFKELWMEGGRGSEGSASHTHMFLDLVTRPGSAFIACRLHSQKKWSQKGASEELFCKNSSLFAKRSHFSLKRSKTVPQRH